jgi:hypothetical protein
MNANVRTLSQSTKAIGPMRVSDQHIRKLLQLAALRFLSLRARLLQHEVTQIGLALKSDEMTPDEADDRLAELSALDLVYPDLMGDREC